MFVFIIPWIPSFSRTTHQRWKPWKTASFLTFLWKEWGHIVWFAYMFLKNFIYINKFVSFWCYLGILNCSAAAIRTAISSLSLFPSLSMKQGVFCIPDCRLHQNIYRNIWMLKTTLRTERNQSCKNELSNWNTCLSSVYGGSLEKKESISQIPYFITRWFR